jgi:hypothetical protein
MSLMTAGQASASTQMAMALGCQPRDAVRYGRGSSAMGSCGAGVVVTVGGPGKVKAIAKAAS